MEDTRARWDRAFQEAVDYDTWGQVRRGLSGSTHYVSGLSTTARRSPCGPCLLYDSAVWAQVEEALEGYQRLQVAAAAVRDKWDRETRVTSWGWARPLTCRRQYDTCLLS